MSCLFSIFSSSKITKRPKLPTFDLQEPKPTFCVYDSDDSDVENNNVQKFDIHTIKYFECSLGTREILDFLDHRYKVFVFDFLYLQEKVKFSSSADTFFAHITLEEKILPFVPQSSYPRIRQLADVVLRSYSIKTHYNPLIAYLRN